MIYRAKSNRFQTSRITQMELKFTRYAKIVMKNFTCLLLISCIWLNLFAFSSPSQTPITSTQTELKGLQFRVTESKTKPTKTEPTKPAVASNLSENETNEILNRLPKMPLETIEKADFKIRSESLKPPKTGNIIPLKFPADEPQATPIIKNPTQQSLKITRFSPEGNTDLVSDVSITFSQPMISVSSQLTASENVPVKLSPEVKGRWRWLGTNTLIFDAETRFPMATKFTATIPKGTKSAIGGMLENDFTWSFSTPPPRVITFLPFGEKVRRNPVLFASFDQEINAENVLSKIELKSVGRKLPVRLATASEVASDEEISKLIKTVRPNYYIAFQSVDTLPSDAKIEVLFDKNLPSAEGALTTTSPQAFTFNTFGNLRLKKTYCGWDDTKLHCDSGQAWKIEFNNLLDEDDFNKSQIKIEPKVENKEISISGNTIEINCYKKTRTQYKVTIPKTLKDEFGQTLAKDISVKFDIGADESRIYTSGDNFVTLDPNFKPNYSIFSTNYSAINVKLFAAKPEDYKLFSDLRASDDNTKAPTIGRLIFDKQIKIKSKPDEQTETKIDLSPAFTNGFGHAILVISSPDKNDEPIVEWIQRTNIGLTALSDYEKLSVFATDLRNGKPLGNVNISLPNGYNTLTNENGIGELNLPVKEKFIGDWIVAKQGEDSAILRENSYASSSEEWIKKPANDELRWVVFNDRNMYRPEETVSIKGYIRKITGGKFADFGELAGSINSLFYVLKDSRGNEIAKGSPNINAFGAFDFQITLPKNINLGRQSLEFTTDSNLENNEFTHNFQVQEFRRPEFEVNTKIETSAPFFVGESAEVSVEAKYYSGGFLSNAETNWNVTATAANYTPPNRDDFTFGKFVPWWKDSGGDDDESTEQKLIGKTDKDGKHQINLGFISANPARPYTLKTQAKVQDVNRQTFAASSDLLVHPSTLYVGIRTPKTFVNKGEKLKIETITTDVDGKAIANSNVSIIAELNDWQKIKGEWQNVVVDTQSCQIVSANDAASCEIVAKQGGTYTIKANVSDNLGRRNESELTVWVSGRSSEPSDSISEENVELIPDKKEYLPNETAEILVNSPFSPAEAVMTLERNGIIKTERFSITENSKVLQIPIEESWLPNVTVRIDLVGTSPRILYDDERDAKLPKRPAFATGELKLDISTASRNLSVTAEPFEKTLEPGGNTKINVDVKDFNGNQVANSEVAIIAVDESVLALTNYKIENPLDDFYPQLDADVSHYHSREDVLLGYPDDIGRGYGRGRGSGNGNGDGMGDGNNGDPFAKPVVSKNVNNVDEYDELISSTNPSEIRVRRNFDALAIFSPSVITDANGKATVDVKLPDNLTRYRITAVAVTKSKQFGLGESTITAKQSLQVRPSAPRFLNFGDKFELPVVIQNQTENALTVNVAVRANNANFTKGNGKKVIVPANDRVEIRFPVSANLAGNARFQIGATSGNLADAAEIELPVYTPATTETFATYGTTDENGVIVQPITTPKDVWSDFGGLEISTSSTQLQELTDAFIYLQNYPFQCSEQVSSRVLSVAALRDVLSAFDAKGLPTKDAIERQMLADIQRLQSLQHSDGGFSFWRNDDESLPYLSVHVAHAIARAKAKDYKIPVEMIAKSKDYLKNIEAKLPKDYSEESRWAISAYALFVRDLLGDKDAVKAKKLLNDVGLNKLSPESIGWILSVLADEKSSANEVELIKRHLLNRVTETAGAAHFVSKYKDGEYVLLSSERRADGVILESLLKVEPNNDLIPKIVRGLLSGRTKGRWGNTQENAFILLALDKYFHVYEKVTPNFVAKVWLGDAFAGEQKFVGRSNHTNSISVPMNYLQMQKTTQNLAIDKQGEGRLYYRIGMNYAPKSLNLASADYGFAVSRKYEAIDDAHDVKQNPDGSWTIKSGSRVRVNVQMVAPTRRYHVALVDNLPAGIEIINKNLATSGDNYVYQSDDIKRRSYWFNHQNLRDNRAEAFTTLLSEGVWNYSYLARATTPGNFVVPPAKAEEMYAPETFGRSKTDFVKVE
jgi:alpha-2-macroglobulin